MKAEDLIKLALLHGTDLRHMAESASRTDQLAGPRRLTHEERKRRMEEHLGLSVEPSAQGSGSRVYRRPIWSADDLGIAAGGNLAPQGRPPKLKMPRMPWLALLHSVVGDRTHYVELHRGLQVRAFKLADRERWPYQVILANNQREYYIERLGSLVLDADACPWAFAPAHMYAWYMDVHPETWDSLLFGRYHSLRVDYLEWVSIALRIVQHWANEPAPPSGVRSSPPTPERVEEAPACAEA